MKTRVAAWLRQAEHDLDVARRSRAAGDHDWACHAAAQSGEKALKAGLLALGEGAVWGHDHLRLYERMASAIDPGTLGDGLKAAARRLNPLHSLTRYPIGESDVPPVDLFGEDDATAAIGAAERLLSWVKGHVDVG
jgi:HEPN domain-containing protein